MIYKRYQYWSKNGIVWTDWFKLNSNLKPKYQFGKTLLNEFKDESIRADS